MQDFEVDETRIVFGFYMASYKLENPGSISFKMNFDSREIAETRSTLGSIQEYSSTGAFAEVFNPKGQTVEMKVLYRSESDGKIQTDSSDQNFSFGVLTFPENDVYKHVHSNSIDFYKSERWTLIPQMELSIKHTEKKESFYLILYNLSIGLPDANSFSARMKIDNNPINETTAFAGPSKQTTLHSALVYKLQQGNHSVKLDYKYDGDKFTVDNFSDARYTQSIVAFKLPEQPIVNSYKLEKTFALDTKNEWKSFDLDAVLNINKKKTVLIIYSINLKVDNANFAARIRIDSRFNKKSTISNSGMAYTHCLGYVVKVLNPGKYTFDIDFKSNSSTIFNPENVELSGEIVNLQIIQLN